MNCRQIPTLVSMIQSAGILADLYLKASLAPANTLTGWSLDDRDPQTIEKLMPFFWLGVSILFSGANHGIPN